MRRQNTILWLCLTVTLRALRLTYLVILRYRLLGVILTGSLLFVLFLPMMLGVVGKLLASRSRLARRS
jgi:hypothetical protein